jgi:hypothetical protein
MLRIVAEPKPYHAALNDADTRYLYTIGFAVVLREVSMEEGMAKPLPTNISWG